MSAILGEPGGFGSPPASHPHGEFDPEKLYEIRGIIGETNDKYLIDWQDDPVTGQSYVPLWEPKENATSAAVQEWESFNAAEKARSATAASVKKRTGRKWGRSRKIVQSSPAATSSIDYGIDAESEEPRTNGALAEVGDSQRSTEVGQGSPASDSPFSFVEDRDEQADARAEQPLQVPEPKVQLPPPSSSVLQGAYEAFSSSQIISGTAPEETLPGQSYRQAEPGIARPAGETSNADAANASSSQAVEVLETSQPDPLGFFQSSPTPSSSLRPPKGPTPEPSLYEPHHPADTSEMTDDTTRKSAEQGESIEHTQSIAVNFRDELLTEVPDSQSLPDSSSFVPSTQSKSSENHDTRVSYMGPTGETEASASEPVNGADQARTQLSQATVDPTARNSSAGPAQFGIGIEDGLCSRAGTPLATGAISRSAGAEFVDDGRASSNDHDRTENASAGQEYEPVRAQSIPSEESHESGSHQQVLTKDPFTQSAPSSKHVQQLLSTSIDLDSSTQSESPVKVASQQSPTSAKGTTPVHYPGKPVTIMESGRLAVSPATSSTRLQSQPASESSQETSTRRPVLISGATAYAAKRKMQRESQSASSDPSSFPFQTQIAVVTNGPSAPPSALTSRAPIASHSSAVKDHDHLNHIDIQMPRPMGILPTVSPPFTASSPIPPIPSQPIHNLGESAPGRPETLSSLPNTPTRSVRMDSPPASDTPSSDFTGKRAQLELAAIRAKYPNSIQQDTASTPDGQHVGIAPPARLGSPAARDARSPSAVPHIEALPIATREEMNTSERCETLLPQAYKSSEGLSRSVSSGRLSKRDKTDASTSFAIQNHVIPIALSGHQRDQYPQTLHHYKDDTEKFLAIRGKVTPAAILEEMQKMVQRLHSVSNHPDLDNNETSTQYDVDADMQSKWDCSASTKFSFLKTLAESLREYDKHMVIFCEAGRLPTMLENFFKGLQVATSRPGVSSKSDVTRTQGALKVTILPTGGEGSGAIVSHADLVVALDHSFKGDSKQRQALRRDPIKVGQMSPLISLVVPNSVEHIEASLGTMEEPQRLRTLVAAVMQMRNQVGKLAQGQLAVNEAASSIAHYIVHEPGKNGWPVAALELLEDLETLLDSQDSSIVDDTQEAPAKPAGTKRPPEDLLVPEPASKRSRLNAPVPLGPSATINLKEIELTHVSDSINPTTQGDAASSEPATPVAEVLMDDKLRKMLKVTQDRLQEHVVALSDLQYRFEEQRQELHDTKQECESANAMAQQAVFRMTEQANSLTALRTERSELKQLLEEAKTRLTNHEVPALAEFEAIRLLATTAEVEKVKAEKKAESIRKDLDYAQGMYQNASSTAQNLAAQNSELESQVAVLEKKATGVQAELRQMNYDAFTKNLQAGNKMLKVVLQDRETLLTRRDEEIMRMKEASRVRMGTRGSSVPRSPRLGSPMTMDVPKLVPGVGGSRHTSPVPGQLGVKGGAHPHPLRNG